MPLARIVTWLAEDTDALAKDLRARGFDVLTESPDEISSEPADLEITVEECASEDALTSASGIARTQDKCVFIAPGAIVENLRPVFPSLMIREPEREMAYDSSQLSESDGLEPLAAIHQLEDRSETGKITSEDVVDFSAAVAEPEVSELAAETASNAQFAAPVAEEHTEPAATVTEPWAEEKEELVTHEFVASVESLPTLIFEPVVPLAAAEIDPGQHSEIQSEMVEVPASVQAIQTEAVLQMQPETIEEAPAVFRAEEVWLGAAEEVSGMRPDPIADMPAESPAILQADVSLIEAEPTSDWPIWHPLAEAEIPAQDSSVPKSLARENVRAVPLMSRTKTVFQQQLPQVVPLMQNAVPVRPNTYRQRMLQKPLVQNDEVFWKTATVLAMVAVAALLVGASANRFSPLPANVAQRSIEAQQPVPFEKARVVPALPLDAGNNMGATELPPARGSDVARFHPALAIEPAAPRILPEAADRANDRLVRAKPRHRSAGHAESDMVAEDTVVRYDKKHPPASHTQAQKNSGVKQYSDLD